MAYFLFLDESGSDQSTDEHEVLGGIAIEDVKLWDLRCQNEIKKAMQPAPQSLHAESSTVSAGLQVAELIRPLA